MSRDIFKIIFVGNSYVGKTAIVNKYTTGTFDEHTSATVGIDFKTKCFDSTNKIKLHIWDTAGQERYKSINKMYYRGVHAIVFVFDLTNLKSFIDVSYWYDSAIRNNGANSILYLVGSKKDKVTKRTVTYEIAIAYAKEHNMKYFEISSFEENDINNMFSCLVGDIICNSSKSLIQVKSIGIKLNSKPELAGRKYSCCNI